MATRQCCECHGYGGHIDVVVDGQGPWERCGACGGTGTMTPKQLGAWLRWKRVDAAERRRCLAAHPAQEGAQP
jgi:hypothetical protein